MNKLVSHSRLTRSATSALLALLFILLPVAAAQQPTLAPWRARLEALSPSNPAAYLELGEEIASHADQQTEPDAATSRLVVELYTLSLELDRRRAGIAPTGASAALALASLAPRAEEKRWLAAIARTLDPRQSTPPWMARPEIESVESEAFRAASAVGLIRSGDGIRARQLLAHPEVRSVIQRSNALIERLGFSGGASRLFRESELWPCTQCADQRILKRPNAAGDARLCTNCDGVPGPRLSDRELLALLQFESWLLDGRQRSWAAQASADGGAPLRDPDPASVASAFRVDARRPYWRNGAWRANADGSDTLPPDPSAISTNPTSPPTAPASTPPNLPPPSGG
jgi:hypothetical protein